MEKEQQNKKIYKNRNIFEYLKNILRDKDMETYTRHVSDESFESDFKKIVLLKYLSMSTNPDVRNVILGDQFLLEKMECKTLYLYLINNVPKQYNTFIQFIK